MTLRGAAERGVTLIELLIAITLVSLLSVGILIAMRVGLSAMEKSQDKLISNRRVASIEKILEQQIEGMMPAGGSCPAAQQGPLIRIPFFQGESDTMRFVSSYSLEDAGRGRPKILELKVVPGENSSGVRLIENEYTYTGLLSTARFCNGIASDPSAGGLPLPRFAPVQPGPASFVVADKLTYCKFSFRQWSPPPAPIAWVPRWVRPYLPSGVTIEMSPLKPDGSRLQVTSLVIPVRVNRDPMVAYEP